MTSLSDVDCPLCLTQIVDLQKLILSHNQISALDEALGGLSSLTLLDVSHNLLTRLPNMLGRYFTCVLDFLVCDDVSIYPSEMIVIRLSQHSCITFAGLSRLKPAAPILDDFNKGLFLSSCIHLYENHCAGTHALFSGVCSLQALKSLDASNNSLSCLPESTGELVALVR